MQCGKGFCHKVYILLFTSSPNRFNFFLILFTCNSSFTSTLNTFWGFFLHFQLCWLILSLTIQFCKMSHAFIIDRQRQHNVVLLCIKGKIDVWYPITVKLWEKVMHWLPNMVHIYLCADLNTQGLTGEFVHFAVPHSKYHGNWRSFELYSLQCAS